MEKLVMRMLRQGESPREQAVRKRLGTVGSAVGVGVNALLAGAKLLIGSLTGSVAVTADAVNNLSDAAGSVVSLVSMRLAQKPVDREHPFGHGRMEYLGALGVGVLILVMGVEMFLGGVRSILNPRPLTLSVVSFVVLAVSVLAKGGLFLFYRALGRMIGFPTLLAAATDAMSDMLATSAVMLSMLASAFWPVPIDGVMGAAVAFLVFKAGFDVVREMVDTLMGGQHNPELGREIIERLMACEDILGTHDLIIHDYGPGRCVASIHAEVPSDGSLLHMHGVIDRAEHEIGDALGISLCIHLDPVGTGDQETDEAHDHLCAVLQKQGDGFMLHDLRIVTSGAHKRLKFDVVVPADFRDTAALTEVLDAAARQLDPCYSCDVHYEVNYYMDKTGN